MDEKSEMTENGAVDANSICEGVFSPNTAQAQQKAPLSFVASPEAFPRLQPDTALLAANPENKDRQTRIKVGNDKEHLSKCKTTEYLGILFFYFCFHPLFFKKKHKMGYTQKKKQKERKHSCPICQKKFKNKRGITEHMRYHNGEIFLTYFSHKQKSKPIVQTIAA
ncbi:hypothetical protein RFI_20263 [Reticulomyxa filosa]|uniref:C2H2-type domain-containing protein n=1 Tax=Reticulomyxa filosa TaxID=46433 RepID=X6MUE4_RETFI|nr:hypothetical protein RFI_20263 [Reticulomyxa filosa]|eukprot:ETO17067.1 hypothetical protein RFI_20263 [Reticulomyxa filosa]